MQMLGTMSTLPRSFVLFLIVFTVGCQSPSESPRQLASDVDIDSNIVGTWKASSFEGLPGAIAVTFAADGSVRFVRGSIPADQATWHAERGWVVITKSQALSSSSLDHWAIWHISDHELVFRRGFSTAGPPETFTR